MKLATYFNAMALAESLFPIAKALAKEIQAELPELDGSAKFAAVKAAVEKYVTEIEHDADVIAIVLPRIGATINSVVELLKASGLFPKALAGVGRVADAIETAGKMVGATGPTASVAAAT